MRLTAATLSTFGISPSTCESVQADRSGAKRKEKKTNPHVYRFESARTAVRARSQLIPYMYSAIKKSHDSLLAMLRPMYHDYPEYDEAYSACTIDGERSQYMFGNDMFIAPVVSKVSEQKKITPNPLLTHSCSRASLKMRLATFCAE